MQKEDRHEELPHDRPSAQDPGKDILYLHKRLIRGQIRLKAKHRHLEDVLVLPLRVSQDDQEPRCVELTLEDSGMRDRGVEVQKNKERM